MVLYTPALRSLVAVETCLQNLKIPVQCHFSKLKDSARLGPEV